MSWEPETILEGAPNARDLGGMRTADGHSVRFGRVLRSGAICDITVADAEYLLSLGLHTVVDFRTDWEKNGKEDVLIDGVEYIDCPMIEVKADGITRKPPAELDDMAQLYVRSAADINKYRRGGAELMRGMYRTLAESDYALEHYRQFFKILLNNESGAVLYHCTMGKDRVGAGTAFLLTALGVPRESIAEDYMYTRVRLGGRTKALLEKCGQYTDDQNILKTIQDMDTVDESYIGAVFSAMDDYPGGSLAYLEKNLCLSSTEIARLKKLYLE
jgi:protein-tyrosine phosphatase